MIDKRVDTLAQAIAGIGDGATILCGGFGAVGSPDHLFSAVLTSGVRDLVLVSNNAGYGTEGLAALILARRVRKIICSFPRTGDSRAFDTAFKEGSLELELVPQGTLSERMRCAAAGLGGFYGAVSVGTRLADGKEHKEIDGVTYVLEKPLRGDVALIRAQVADRWGNLCYRKAARNFNPVMAMAAKLTVAEVATLAELGDLDPDNIHTPGIFVDRIVKV